MSAKKCFKCGKIKQLDEYYRHDQMADGHLNKCIECTKADVRANSSTGIGRSRQAWSDMIKRCSDGSKYYNRYGGRGIKVCQEWLGDGGFERFYEDMGPRPIGLQLDRVDNDLGYYKGNCRWATTKQQGRNRSNTRMVVIYGDIRPLVEWSEITGIDYRLIHDRLNKGWSPFDAVSKRRGLPQ